MAALKKSLVNVGTQIGHTTAACKTRGEIKCFINVIKVKSCLINEPRWIIRRLASDLRAWLVQYYCKFTGAFFRAFRPFLASDTRVK